MDSNQATAQAAKPRTYKLQFTGRPVGAIGAFTAHEVALQAADAAAARLKLYDTHEHISGLQIIAQDLPAFRITFEDGTYYDTSMALGTTLEAAKAYFLNEAIEGADGITRYIRKVEEVQP